ncbi:protein kinase [Sansalvadorimonas sp. 2012CJ34-2]|uniref:Protein kinase n=1 Tax=Parendozoicomonas callyspongiae TaxID=2942213 RepID=A0ABT0PK61_9GAMM|nr:protein kinase [Sansalvadorimonas sp. 2012CJ34-2]MCL6271718.1 protein kinase [Sansalvadorimonas sp. 2012CJ34-2]
MDISPPLTPAVLPAPLPAIPPSMESRSDETLPQVNPSMCSAKTAVVPMVYVPVETPVWIKGYSSPLSARCVENYLNDTLTMTYVNRIDEGGFSKISAWQGPDGHIYAVKIIDSKHREKTSMKGELKALPLRHPNIVRTYGVVCQADKQFHVVTEDTLGATKADEVGIAAIVTELVPGKDVMELRIRDELPDNLETYLSIVIQTCKALTYLHQECQLVHFDVKEENIMYDKETGAAKLIDLSFLRSSSDESFTAGVIGTYKALSPELIQTIRDGKRMVNDPSVDIWAVGSLLMSLLTSSHSPAQFNKAGTSFFPNFVPSKTDRIIIEQRILNFAKTRPNLKKLLIKSKIYNEKILKIKDILDLTVNLLSEKPEQRYSIDQVVKQLEEISVRLPVPPGKMN